MLKLRNHPEWTCRRSQSFTCLVDQSLWSVTKESRALANVQDSAGFESHQSGAGCVGSHWIICQHNLPQRTRGAVEWSVSFHRHDPVCNYEADRKLGLRTTTLPRTLIGKRSRPAART